MVREPQIKVAGLFVLSKLCASAIQVNIVNTSVGNPIDGVGQHMVEALNEKYKRGYRLDIKAVESNKPQTVQIGRKHFSLVRGQT